MEEEVTDAEPAKEWTGFPSIQAVETGPAAAEVEDTPAVIWARLRLANLNGHDHGGDPPVSDCR